MSDDWPKRLARYRRPALPARVFADDAGAPIAYGERWGASGPPDDAYERVTHPERFAPLHDVADAAPLTLVFTDFPGVVVIAGALFEAAFPTCGCDACDETAASQTDELEGVVFAIAEGGFGEAYPIGAAGRYAHAIVAPNGWQPWS